MSTRTTLYAVILAFTFALVTANFYQLFKDDLSPRRSPITVIGMELITPQVPTGGEVVFDLTVRKTAQCPAFYHYEFTSEGGEILRGNVVKGGSFPISAEPVTRRFRAKLPDFIWPEMWTMTIPGWVACDNGTWPVIHPPLSFEVTDG